MIQVIGMDDAGKLAERMEGGPEPVGKGQTSIRPHSALWQQLLEDAKTLDPGKSAGELCLQTIAAWLYAKIKVFTVNLLKARKDL